MKNWFYILILVLFAACHNQQPGDPLQRTEASTNYASLLQMQDLKEGVTLCRLMNPWQPEIVAIQYLLSEQAELDEDYLQELELHYGPFQQLQVPMERQTVTSSCHLWLLDQLGALASVSVVCDAEYVMLPVVQQALQAGTLRNGGKSMAPDAEVIRAAQSPCIWVSPFEASSQQLMAAQLPEVAVIFCADYMENSALARAEWMRFYGRLVGRAAQADSLFGVIEKNYNQLAADTLQLPKEPLTLLPELPFGATWYVPGGRSTMSWLYQDAGFRYPWAEDVHGGSLALSLEAVYAKAYDADRWIIKYNEGGKTLTMADLLAKNPLFQQFRAAQNGEVYGCNTAVSDLFDVTPFRPDLLLQEMRHLRLGEESELHFFQRLQ